MPLISVVIPLYNKEGQIENAINSVINQKYSDWELVIVNDGSTDGSLKKVLKFRDSRIRVFTQNNAGVSSARNKGVEISKGQWIAFLDADDVFYPNWLEFCSVVLLQVNSCEMVVACYHIKTDAEFIEVNPWRDKFINGSASKKANEDKFELMTGDFFASSLKKHPPVCASGVCLKRVAFIEAGGFDKNIKCGEDLQLWANLALSRDIIGSAIPLVCYNRSAEQDSTWGAWYGADFHPNWRHWFINLEYELSNQKDSNKKFKTLSLARLWMIKMIEDDARKALLSGDKNGAIKLLWPIEFPAKYRYFILLFLCFLPISTSSVLQSLRGRIKKCLRA